MVWIDFNDDFRIYTEEKRTKEKNKREEEERSICTYNDYMKDD